MNTMLFEVPDASIFDEKDALEIYFKPKSCKSFYPFNLLSLSLKNALVAHCLWWVLSACSTGSVPLLAADCWYSC